MEMCFLCLRVSYIFWKTYFLQIGLFWMNDSTNAKLGDYQEKVLNTQPKQNLN